MPRNAKAGSHGAGQVPFNRQAVISKLDIKLRTLTLIGPPSADTISWAPQTPRNPTDDIQKKYLVKNRIACHRGCSPTPVFATIAAWPKIQRYWPMRLLF